MFRNIIKSCSNSMQQKHIILQLCKRIYYYDINRPLSDIQVPAFEQDSTEKLVGTPRTLIDEVGRVNSEKKSVLEVCEEDISHIAPYLKPTFNFASYINKSETLQQMVKMGVNLYKIEKITDAPQYILGLNFDNDMKPYIIFLHDLGLTVDCIANIVTKNPFIFKEDIDNLQVRINYLQSKRFTNEMILRIIEKNPYLLSHSTQDIDGKLGFIKTLFEMTANELRNLVTHQPKLITYNEKHIKKNVFVMKEEMGFTPEELKKIVLKCPNIVMKSDYFIRKTFDYLHSHMKINLETIVMAPEILTCRENRLKQRHMFLEKLNRAQYDPKKPNYISLASLVYGDDSHFCTDIAKSSVQTYNMFLKTM